MAKAEFERTLRSDIEFNSTADREKLANLTQVSLDKMNMSLIEHMYFFDKLNNKAAHFSGSLYSNGQYRDEEIMLQFSLNSKFDAFNLSKKIEVEYVNGSDSQVSRIKICDHMLKMRVIRNFWQVERRVVKVNITIDTVANPLTDGTNVNSLLSNPDNLRFRMLLTSDHIPNV